MIKLTIPGKIQPKQRPRVANGVAYTPKETVLYENLIKQIWMISGKPKIDGLLQVVIRAYFPVPKSYTKKRLQEIEDNKFYCPNKVDADNVAKIILDALNNLAYDDDSQVVKLQVEKYYSNDPRLEIEIDRI
jgi:Holliday junction resolvase RusA-like endonuclease